MSRGHCSIRNRKPVTHEMKGAVLLVDVLFIAVPFRTFQFQFIDQIFNLTMSHQTHRKCSSFTIRERDSIDESERSKFMIFWKLSKESFIEKRRRNHRIAFADRVLLKVPVHCHLSLVVVGELNLMSPRVPFSDSFWSKYQKIVRYRLIFNRWMIAQ